jgi:anti-sigma-K factor RskA
MTDMAPEVHTLTGPYVLNALPEDERAGFEAHLADCTACRQEVAELTEVAVRLGSAAAADPPDRLKGRVMATIGTTRQLPPEPRHRAPSEEEEIPERRYTRRNLLTLAAAGLAVAGAGGFAVDQYRDASRARRDSDQLAALLAEPDAQTVRGPVTGGGRATVVSSRSQDTAMVILDRLPEAPTDHEYQLWFLDDEQQARSIGLIGQAPRRTSTVTASGIADAAAFGLTVEPEGGSAAPTTKPLTVLPMT